MTEPVLSVRDLRVEFRHQARRARRRSTASRSTLRAVRFWAWWGNPAPANPSPARPSSGLIDPPGRIAGGEVLLSGQRIDNLSPDEMRKVRGKRIGMIFQDPLTSLNPLYQRRRPVDRDHPYAHLTLSASAARKRAIELLAEVGIPAPDRRIDSYPHEFSGGMRQRVVIALALCAEPELIIADEPTTALDVSVQAQIIALLKRLARDHGTAVMLVTHDMGVIAETADRVAVMYAGRIVEIGPVREVVQHPLHPYAKGLMGAIPSLKGETIGWRRSPAACRDYPRCRPAAPSIRGARSCSTAAASSAPSPLPATCIRSPAISTMRLRRERSPSRERETLRTDQRPRAEPSTFRGLGSIGCSNVPTAIAEGCRRRVLRYRAGRDLCARGGIRIGQVDCCPHGGGPAAADRRRCDDRRRPMVGRASAQERQRLRRRIQMIFQDPYASLDPRWKVEDIVAEPIRAFRLIEGDAAIGRTGRRAASLVGLHPADGLKFPHEFSGGQRQRIAIARALGADAEFIVCDEPTSALDVSVQAQILNLMRDLQDQFGLTYLFISHNLAVVRHMATTDRRHVSRAARRDLGRPRAICRAQHPYTRMLLDAVPDMSMAGQERVPVRARYRTPSIPPSGCHVQSALPVANERCRRRNAALACRSCVPRGPRRTPWRFSPPHRGSVRFRAILAFGRSFGLALGNSMTGSSMGEASESRANISGCVIT